MLTIVEPKTQPIWQKVWDLPTRVYHWAQAVIVFAALATGYLAPEWWLTYHVWLGYTIGILLVFRFGWGFFGSHYSRFASFIFSREQTLDHIHKTLHKQTTHHTGHNPLGALMVFTLLGILALILLTGLLNLGGVEKLGPLAGFVSFSSGDKARAIHSLLALVIMVLIAGHLLGVLLESRLGKVALVRAMITGKKPVASPDYSLATKRAQPSKAILFMMLIATFGVGAGYWLKTTFPIPVRPLSKVYLSECGDCHEPYHPSLLPAASWAKLISGLDNHFGEDASLGERTTAELAKYLNANNASKWDTEAANHFALVDSKAPFQITATPFWKHRHANVDKKLFSANGGKNHCSGCHGDAATGLFADAKIALPDLSKLSTQPAKGSH